MLLTPMAVVQRGKKLVFNTLAILYNLINFEISVETKKVHLITKKV